MIEQTRLDNGLRVITEPIRHVRSASVGVWVESGSRHEPAALNGICHFIEHAVFKGTARRSPLDIAVESDRQGGHLNASTGHENTCFHTRVLDEHLPQAFDLIGDMLTNPTFAAEELERERSVILEEIKMVEDSPDEFIQDIFTESLWPTHALGRPISGTVETVSSFTRDAVDQYFRERYNASSMLVTAAGNFRHADVVRMAEELFGRVATGTREVLDPAPGAEAQVQLWQKEGLEQAHLLLGFPCPPVTSPDRYAVNLMSAILGDGMSSRLFQRIREERGLVYGIYSSVEAFLDTGIHEISAGTSPENVEEVVELVAAEIRALKNDGPTEDELRVAKDSYKVATVLSLESTFNRMSRLARHELCYGRQIDLDEILAALEAVTIDDVVRVAHDVCQTDRMAITVLGDVEDIELDRELAAC